MKLFFESNACKSRTHCETCRKLVTGRAWRNNIGQHFELPDNRVDFGCPYGVPWSEPGEPTDERVTELTVSARPQREPLTPEQRAERPQPTPEQRTEAAKKTMQQQAFKHVIKAIWKDATNSGSCPTCGDTRIGDLLTKWTQAYGEDGHGPFFVTYSGDLKSWLKDKAATKKIDLSDEQLNRAVDAGRVAYDTYAEKHQPLERGPGKMFSAMIKEATGFSADLCELCTERARQMNLWGYTGCIRRWRQIAGWLAEQRKLHGLEPNWKMCVKAVRGALKYALRKDKS